MSFSPALLLPRQWYDNWAPSAVNLVLRLWIAAIFFQSGLTKTASWETTIMLFEGEYQVPLLPPLLAAWLATGVELIAPAMLLLGLFARPAALALFVLNAVAVISYPDISEAGVKDHQYWAMLIAIPLTYGAGRLSLDRLVQRYLNNRPAHVAQP